MKLNPHDCFIQTKDNVRTLTLSTITEEFKPNISYAPYIQDENGNFYLFLSQLASHTQDLLSHPKASVLLIEDEQDSTQIFARHRITYQCQVEVILADEPTYEPMLNKMQLRFGSVIELLRTLPDFILFKLHPYHGQFVMGFGQAFELEGRDLSNLVHIEH